MLTSMSILIFLGFLALLYYVPMKIVKKNFNRKTIYLCFIIFFVMPGFVFIGLIGGIGFVLVFVTLGEGLIFLSSCAHLSEDKKKTCELQKHIQSINSSKVVFVKSQQLYAIPIHASFTDVSTLHPSIVNSNPKQPKINISVKKYPLPDIYLVDKASKDLKLYSINQMSSLVKNLYLEVEPQEKELKEKLFKVKELEKLAKLSRLHNSKSDVYSKIGVQIKSLLEDNQKLGQEYKDFIFDILVGQELESHYSNLENIPDVLKIQINLNHKYKLVSDEYQFILSEMDEYIKLKN
jgi:hypothetical protein